MESSVKVIQESEFVPLANKAAMNLLRLAELLTEKNSPRLSKSYYVTLMKEAVELEDYLDDHGARNNRTWVYFGEIVASIRSFSRSAHTIRHIIRRINFYRLDSTKTDSFVRDANKRLAFIDKSIVALCANLIDEARHLGLSIRESKLNGSAFEDKIIEVLLPYNISEEGSGDIESSVSRVAKILIDTFESSQTVMFKKKTPLKNLDDGLIPARINEETLRQVETLVHNAQSMYDTYVKKTPFESEHSELPSLRGTISITLHLMVFAKELCHFYERHEAGIRNEATRQKIEKIISSKKILDIIVNFALYYFTAFIKDGRNIARQVLETFTYVDSACVNVPEGLGFHLRPSTLVAKIVNHYGSKVTMCVNSKEFDASSVIDIMWAGGMIRKESINRVDFRGDRNAINDLRLLAGANYGEDSMGNSTPLPQELAYLRQ